MNRLLPLGVMAGLMAMATATPSLAYPSPDDDIDYRRNPIAPLVQSQVQLQQELQQPTIREVGRLQIQPHTGTASIPQVVPCMEDLPPGIWGAGCIANPYPHPQVN